MVANNQPTKTSRNPLANKNNMMIVFLAIIIFGIGLQISFANFHFTTYQKTQHQIQVTQEAMLKLIVDNRKLNTAILNLTQANYDQNVKIQNNAENIKNNTQLIRQLQNNDKEQASLLHTILNKTLGRYDTYVKMNHTHQQYSGGGQ